MIAEYLLSKDSSKSSIEDAVEHFCIYYEWLEPIEIIEKTYANLNNIALPTDDIWGVVINEYYGFQLRSLQLRKANPLLNLSTLIQDHQIRPPLHRKIYPNGDVQLRASEDNQSSQAWLHFFIITNLIKEMTTKGQISCPVAHRNPVIVFPGTGECRCEMGLNRCLAAQLVDKLEIDLISLYVE